MTRQHDVLEWTSGAAATESGARSIMAESLGTDGRPTAVVRVDNEAAVSAGELESAEGRAADVFRRIGLRVTWVDKETAIREHIHASYTVVVMVANRSHDVHQPAAKRGQACTRRPMRPAR